MEMSVTFPKGFLWGAASSAPQFEGASYAGGKSETVWDVWYKTEPQKFHNGIGPMMTANFYSTYEDDILKMKELGFNSFRTSIAWARLMPDGKNINPEAVAYYRSVFKKFNEMNITPIINLYHFDMPYHFHLKGGWESRETVKAYVQYANVAFEHFGDLVVDWVTFNEPMVSVEMGYLNKLHLPAVKDMKRAVTAGFNMMLAHKEAVKVFKELSFRGRIGIILNVTPTYAKSFDPKDQKAAYWADLVYNRSFLDPAIKGCYPKELLSLLEKEGIDVTFTEEEELMIGNYPIDFLGVNYYQPRRVQKGDGESDFMQGFEKYFLPYKWPSAKMNPHRGWEIYEKGLYDIAMNIKDNYNNLPWYVAENGIGIEGEEHFVLKGEVVDDYRIEFIKNHLQWLHKGILEGSNCFGYHAWTFIDNWSWLNGFKNRYGFYRLDLNTQERIPKRSGRWFKTLASNNRLEI